MAKAVKKTARKAEPKREKVKASKAVVKKPKSTPAKKTAAAKPKAAQPKKPAAKPKPGAAKKKTVKPAAKSVAKTAVRKKAVITKKAAAPKKAAKPAKRAASPAKKAAAKRTSAKPAAPKKTAATQSPAKRPASRRAPKINADEVIKEFRSLVNIPAGELERRLATADSKKLGRRDVAQAGIEGQESGRRILKILAKRRNAYTEDDLRHMQAVVSYVRLRRKEKPPGDIFASNWRFSLMNWGHDPMKRKR
ncbi:MAG: DUF3140 domain-containing protein [Pyrinomonadaceae bacterium]|nr:DUF3140 domain-containing protein [Pyrinomonadaceae bacterium]